MQKINKLTGLPSVEPPTSMGLTNIVEAQKIQEIVDRWLCKISKGAIDRVVEQTNKHIRPYYIEFDTQELEDEYLSLETIAEKTAFLDAHEGEYLSTRDLHPNVKYAYSEDEKTYMNNILITIESLQSQIDSMPDNLFNVIDRLSEG